MAASRDKKGIWIGFDLGGTKMQAVVYDDALKILGKARKRTKAYEGQQSGLDRTVAVIKKALDKADVSVDRIRGIGVGSPGPLDPQRGVLIDLPNLGWQDVPLGATLEKAFGCQVHVINDVDAGTYGEARFGAGKGARTVLGVFPGTGIGSGCVYEGTILMGKGMSILELGHCCVDPGGALCGCGNHGCLETVASRLTIASAAAAAAYRGDAPYLLEHTGMDLPDIRSGALSASIAGGDKAIETIVRNAARWLGIGVSHAVNMLLPDVVVLGGGLVEALPELYLKDVTKAAKAHSMAAFRDAFCVRVAELGDYATSQGAAAWAQQCAEE